MGVLKLFEFGKAKDNDNQCRDIFEDIEGKGRTQKSTWTNLNNESLANAVSNQNQLEFRRVKYHNSNLRERISGISLFRKIKEEIIIIIIKRSPFDRTEFHGILNQFAAPLDKQRQIRLGKSTGPDEKSPISPQGKHGKREEKYSQEDASDASRADVTGRGSFTCYTILVNSSIHEELFEGRKGGEGLGSDIISEQLSTRS